MNVEELKNRISEAVTHLDIEIIAVGWRFESSRAILQIVIDKPAGTVDLALCTAVSEICDPIVDELTEADSEEFFLEVCSSGSEKPLEDEKQLMANLGKYVAVSFKEPIGKLSQVKGYLEKADTGYKIDCFVKGVKKKVLFTYQDIENIHLTFKV